MDNNEIQFQQQGPEPQYKEIQTNSGMTGWLMKHSGGIIKTDKQAQWILLGFVALVIITAIFILSSGSNQPTSGLVPTDQIVP